MMASAVLRKSLAEHCTGYREYIDKTLLHSEPQARCASLGVPADHRSGSR
jgi:hypothetical protein